MSTRTAARAVLWAATGLCGFVLPSCGEQGDRTALLTGQGGAITEGASGGSDGGLARADAPAPDAAAVENAGGTGGTAEEATAEEAATPDAGVPSAAQCAQHLQEVAEELARLRACTTAADCGATASVGSCGCTRATPLRADADERHYVALLTSPLHHACAASGGSTCDCPPADGFLCRDAVCVWNYRDTAL